MDFSHSSNAMEFIHTARTHETIAAVSTPPGVGGIAIVRVSGAQAIPAVGQLMRHNLSSQQSHTAQLVQLHSVAGTFLDKALVLVMKGPRSFTGEDVVEIQCHGGHIIAKKVLEALADVGVRMAFPGEFSLRAFLHGKIDMAQAEALQDLIGAQSETALKVAQEQLEGKLSGYIKTLQQRAVDIAAIFEAWVDFPEDDLGFCSFDDARCDLQKLKHDVDTLIASFAEGKMLSTGVSMCILGAPNVGKSSLMNALLGKDRAIVSPVAGTTRDIVEDYMCIRGVHYKLVDTAGIRESQEYVEQEGIRRSKIAMQHADVILTVVDASRPQDSEMMRLVEDVPEERCVLVWNKIDLAGTRPLPCHGKTTVVEVSSKTGEGMESLMHAIDAVTWKQKTHRQDEVIITKIRHKEALEMASNAITRTLDGLAQQVSAEFIALEMRDVLVAFGSILGTNITDDVLNTIFSKFCIGK